MKIENSFLFSIPGDNLSLLHTARIHNFYSYPEKLCHHPGPSLEGMLSIERNEDYLGIFAVPLMVCLSKSAHTVFTAGSSLCPEVSLKSC